MDANEAAVAAGVATGVQFGPVNWMMLEAAIGRAQSLWRNPKDWARLQTNGMRAEVGWSRPARRYAEIYRGLALSAGG